MANIKIADKPTLDTVKTNTETTNTKIGNTADSGASASTGSVNGKLNKIITDASTNMGYVMAGEGVTGTISTATVTATASGTKRAKVGNFSITHTGKGSVVIKGTWSPSSGTAAYFFVSTTNTASPSATTESNAIATTQKAVGINQIWFADINNLNTGTYYVYAVITNTGTETPDLTVSSIHGSVNYATTTPCQSIVKSVQRGILDLSKNGSGEINIETVAPEKCLVTINGVTWTSGYNSDSWGNNGACILQADKLHIFWKIGQTNSSSNQLGKEGTYTETLNYSYQQSAVFWQIIEFY